MGEIATATLAYDKILAADPNSAVYKTESMQAKAVQTYIAKAEECYARQDYRSVIFCMDKSIEISPECRKFRVLKAECLALLKRYQESQEIVNDVLRQDGLSADAVYVRGLCLYYQDSVDKAFKHFQQVLRLAPDHSKAREVYRKAKALTQKKDEGNAAFKAGKMQEAYDLYTDALAIDASNVFTNSKLYFNRATVCSKLKKPDGAIEDCSKAIELDENYVKAYLRRAKSYMELEQYDEAVRDYEKICKLDKTREHKQLLQEAKLELKKSKRKDYYKILGLAKDANEDAIKKAYKKHALLHHPDRHMSATEEVKKAEEKKFKEIGEAYGVLSDAKKKARYDSGQDLEEHEGMGGFHDIDPNIIFQSFFGGGQGFSGANFQQQQGFPGGFSYQFG
jgi:DnaJ family protein C protein 7